MKPYSEACNQNCHVILDVIKPLLSDRYNVLEVGSGTGQHALFFAKKMPHLICYTSDRVENHSGIQQWLDESDTNNIRRPIALDVSRDVWPSMKIDTIFSANTLHIMAWESVIDLFKNAGILLTKGGFLILYGPFNYHGKYTSDSNKCFDAWLKNRDPKGGVRDFEAINKLANEAGFTFIKDYEMPANNRILQWLKI